MYVNCYTFAYMQHESILAHAKKPFLNLFWSTGTNNYLKNTTWRDDDPRPLAAPRAERLLEERSHTTAVTRPL